MALKLISILSVVIFISFAYKVWDKTKVPSQLPADEVWKVKTIEFVSRVVQKMIDYSWIAGKDVHSMRPLVSYVSQSLHYGIWPFITARPPNDSLVISQKKELGGVPVIVYQHSRYKGDRNKPALIYFHGGGWEWLGAEDPSPILRALTRELGIITISVDYRLAPEHRYPAALDDCVAVTEYVLQNHIKLGINYNKVMVGGDNSGGNLAAAVALKLKKRLKLQILINPVLQAYDFKLPSYRENSGKLKYIMQPEKMVKAITTYGGLPEASFIDLLENRHIAYISNSERYRELTHTKQVQDYYLHVSNLTTLPASHFTGCGDFHLSQLVQGLFLDPYFMPLMSWNLDSITNAYIVTSQHDIVRDDGLIYAARISNSWNVEYKLDHHPAGFHNFIHFSEGPLKLGIAQQALKNLIYYISKHVVMDT